MTNNSFSKKNDAVVVHEHTDDTKALVKFMMIKCPDVTLTEEDKTFLDGLDRDNKILWLKEKLMSMHSSIANTAVENILNHGDVFNNIKDPFDISVDDLEQMMKFTTDEEHKKNLREIMERARKQLKVIETNDYITSRGRRNADGNLDRMISVDEIKMIDNNVEKKLKAYSRNRSGIRDADKLSGVVNTFNDMSVESRYTYEGYKEGVCNDFGVTPESFDKFFAAVLEDNTNVLNTQGINIRTDLYNIKDIMKKHKHLLEHVPGWKRGDVVYVSEFNNKIKELDRKELENAKGTPESKALYDEMLKYTFHDPSNPQKLKQSHVSATGSTFTRKRNKNKQISVNKSEPEVKTENSPVVQKSSVDLTQFVSKIDSPKGAPSDEKIDVFLIHNTKEEQEKYDQLKQQRDELDMKYEELKRKEAELLAREAELNKQQSEEKPEVVEVEKSEPKSRISGSRIDEVSAVRESEADPSILRRGGNRLELIKQYKESHKRGRTLFLPNSNYEVYVKKIKSTDSINYMMMLINNTKDINMVDGYVKSEILRICYENIEFPFEEHVSYTDFIKCLHESDMTLLMVMLALVNIPENQEGKIPLKISSVMCSNPECNAIGHLKESIVLDLKEEFVNMYPVEDYSRLYAQFKNAGYTNIYQAYRNSLVGKIHQYTVKDENFEYNYLLSSPTIYKTQAIKSYRDEVSYRRVIDKLTERHETYDDDNTLEILDYMRDHTYGDFVNDLDIASNSDKDSSDVSRETKSLLLKISNHIEDVKKNDLPFYLILDVIDSITMTTLDGVEVVTNLDQSDIYTLLGILEQVPREMLDHIIQTKNDSLDKSYPVDITFTSEEMAGKFDFDGYYGTDEEIVEEIHRRYEGSGASEKEINDTIEAQRRIRNDVKPKYEEDAVCFCGNKTWKLNYTAILFFWTSNQSPTLLK